MPDLNTPQEESGLAQELESFVQYQHATRGQRFLNFFIDNLLMRYGLSWVTGFLVGILLQGLAPEFLARIAYDEISFDILLLFYIVGIFNYLLYYTICEKAFKGYTLGKLISGTRAIRDDGEELTFRDAFLRSLSRLVPFEILSGFGTPWHDSWTNTSVIKTR